MSLIQKLPQGPLDIVGDIHGEHQALLALLDHLGYDGQGRHAQDRMLVFVGDFCDRGPDSPAVLALAARLIESGRAVGILGNHEINLLRQDAKDGSGWFFDERVQRDHDKYAPFQRPSPAQRQDISRFLVRLPIALEREDLRIVHAAWLEDAVAAVRQLPADSVRQSYDAWEDQASRQIRASGLQQRMQEERQAWRFDLEDKSRRPPFLHAHAEYEILKQMVNPLKVMTSGVEREGTTPFFAGGKWRFVQRVGWWDEYDQSIPVVVGHYWRQLQNDNSALFSDIPPLHWHGKRSNVFCVDYSVGARWQARKKGLPQETNFKLAALRWPERTLQFDDGSHRPTQGFAGAAPAGSSGA